MLAACARVESGHTPLHPADFQLPPATVMASVSSSRTGQTTVLAFNTDSLLERRAVIDKAGDIVTDERYNYSGGRLTDVTVNGDNTMQASYDTRGRLTLLRGDNAAVRYCYNAERPLQLDTVKVYDIKADGSLAAEPSRRTDLTHAHPDGRLSGIWERDFSTNTVHARLLKSDGHTDSLRRHYVAGKVNTRLQSGKAGNTVQAAQPLTTGDGREKYYTRLTERKGSSKRGAVIDAVNVTIALPGDTAALAAVAALLDGDKASAAGDDAWRPADTLSTMIDNFSDPAVATIAIVFVVIFILLTFALIYFADRRYGLLANFWGPRVPYGKMRRLWMFNTQPYVKMATVTALIILAFVMTLALFQLAGYGMAALIWLMRTASIVILAPALLLMWGWVVALLLYLFSSTVRAIINKYIIWLLKLSPIILLGTACIVYEEQAKLYGDRLATWCTTMLSGLTLEGVAAHWRLVLAIVLAPAAVFLAIAAGTILVTALLMAAEWLMMKAYRVHLRCPHCGSDDHDWLHADGSPHPVALHPGIYGVLHHDYLGQRMPTMLMGGKGRLPRRCRGCGNVTRSGETDVNTFGTDIHIGFVGGPGTGKSWLMYEGLHRLIAAHQGTMRQHGATRDTGINAHHTMIAGRRDFQTDATRYTHAVQVMVDRRGQPVPWHTHWWDVAGENFDSARQATDMEFYRHVRVVALVLDPLLTIVPDNASDAFRRWTAAQGRRYSARYDAERAVSALDSILTQAGNSARRVHVVVTLAKADNGYLRDVAGIDYDTATGEALRRFALEHMGLHNLDNVLSATFASVEYAAASATDHGPALLRLFTRLLHLAGA